MGKKTLIVIAVGIFLLGIVGVTNAVKGLAAAAPVGDQTARGKITRLAATAGRLPNGMPVAKRYSFAYAFRTEGKLYFGEQLIDKSAFQALSDGDQVTVHYESGNPRVSEAATIGGDSSAVARYKSRLKVCSGVALFGLLIAVLACFCKDEKRRSIEASSMKFSDDPIAALSRWRSEWQVGSASIC